MTQKLENPKRQLQHTTYIIYYRFALLRTCIDTYFIFPFMVWCKRVVSCLLFAFTTTETRLVFYVNEFIHVSTHGIA
jgi:hypothetical protein